MIKLMAEIMRENDAPLEQFERIGIPVDGVVGQATLHLEKETRRRIYEADLGLGEEWTEQGREAYFAVQCLVPAPVRLTLLEGIKAYVQSANIKKIDDEAIAQWVITFGPQGESLLKMLKMLVL